MAVIDKKSNDAAQAEYAAQFDAPEEEKPEQTEDEAFGLGPEAGADQSAAAAAPAAAEAAAPAAGPSDAEKAQADRAAELDAREAELNTRAASMQTSNTNEVQTSSGGDKGEGKEGEAMGSEEADPAAALAEDFGPEFVELLRAFIKQVATESVTEDIGGLKSTVQSVIDDLQNERNASHFKAIASAHGDFMDIVSSPEFAAWKDSQPDAEKADLQRVIDQGSAQEIIDMLTKFKASNESAGDGGNEDALDAAEGVRSSGLKLPTEPKASQDYAAAWAEA
jgi:hypothetical protein